MIENTSTVVKSRGPIKALRDGNRLYMDNFTRLLKRSWTTTLIYAIVAGIYTTVLANNTGFFAQCILSLLLFIMITAMLSQGFATLKEHQENGAILPAKHWYGTFHLKLFVRILKFNLSMLLPFVVIIALAVGMFYLSTPMGLIPAVIIASITAFILSLFTLPLIYGEYQYVLNKQTKLSTAYGKSYTKGLHHLPSILGTFLLCVICIFIITQFLQLPRTILIVANIIARRDLAMGDAVVLPGYMIWLEPILFSISGFIQGYLFLFMVYPFYYLYISINNK
ncbi:hypothetical protein [Xylanibacter brevis]|uniref:hypothetical protein n=1 Tax=Xylanibacter brevis TaxID=83231 RepID=UPI000485DC0E|nr:hypothetical protein [Xylanibacter brevis]